MTGMAAVTACINGVSTAESHIDPKGLKISSAELVNSALSTDTQRQITGVEPTLEEAVNYWPDMENIYTPVGWPDHMHRFNVLWNGAILAKPNLNRRTTQYEGLGAFIRLLPRSEKEAKYNYVPGTFQDINYTDQLWQENTPAPVLLSRSYKDGVILQSAVFAHPPFRATQ